MSSTSATRYQSWTVPNRRVSLLAKPLRQQPDHSAQLRRESLITASALAELQQDPQHQTGQYSRSRRYSQIWITACVLALIIACWLLSQYTARRYGNFMRRGSLKTASPPANRRNAFTCSSGTITIIAHADDDLLFQSPYIIGAIQDGCFTTVVTSAGDAGQGLEYARLRERGNEAAHARMLDVEDKWTEHIVYFAGQPSILRTLVEAPRVQNVYMRIPDGNSRSGYGYEIHGFQSLLKLYKGELDKIKSQGIPAVYSLPTLKQAYGEILQAASPHTVLTHDFGRQYNEGDHPDHVTIAKLVLNVAAEQMPKADVLGFVGYPAKDMPANIESSGDDYEKKSSAFFGYTPFDYRECQNHEECGKRGEEAWLQRQYIVKAHHDEDVSRPGDESPE